MKTIIREKITSFNYPVLLQDYEDGDIVLFTEPTTGTLLVAGKDALVGYTSKEWPDANDKTCWKVFEGIVELSND